MPETGSSPVSADDATKADGTIEVRRQEALLKTGALQNAILTSANFSIIATDEKGIIQLFNVGAERMLGYLATEVVNRISPSDMHDPQEVMARAQLLSLELDTTITPGFEALAFKASRGIEDIYELTYICKDGSRFPAIVSITALRDDYSEIIGYLLELINEILDLALIESGKLSLSLEPISLADVMLECQAMIEPQAKKRGIRVTFPLFAIPYFVKADRTRVKQVLINLLSNSIKYNKVDGTVVVSCMASPLGRIRICVEDSGEGLTQEKVTQLFQPFNRLGQEANVEEGTGIGLVVCKRLIEWMGGVIGVESTVDKGSVFWIEMGLTAAPQATADIPKLAAVAQAQVHADAQLCTAPLCRGQSGQFDAGGGSHRAPARHSFAECARRQPWHRDCPRLPAPDVILMDINLPGISGIKALGILAEDPATAHIPVVALSANAMPRDIEKGLEAGFFRYLTKPIKVNEFMDTLDVALKLAEAKSTLAAKAEPA